MSRLPRVVALGGGHGLSASLSALMRLDAEITAIVTVADDGGSSGRIRAELDVLPPGDLRMALATMASAGPLGDARWSEILQYRLGGSGPLAGHAVGNLLLTGLMELRGDAVAALDELALLVNARGRVLPMSVKPLDLVAEVLSTDPNDPVSARLIHGQSAIASTSGRVRSLRLIPADPPACDEALRAIAEADLILLGPGSWFTSVLPHLLVPELAESLISTPARLMVVLNLEPQVGETTDFSPEEHLRVLTRHCPKLRIDAVIADSTSVTEPAALRSFVSTLSAELILAPVAEVGASARHDPVRLSVAIADASGLKLHHRDVLDEFDAMTKEGVQEWR